MSYFSTIKTFLFVPFNDTMKEDEFLKLLDQTNLYKLFINTNFSSQIGRPSYNPYHMLSTIIYSFAKHNGSLRNIEESVKFDLRFIYLMEQESPTHVSFSNFINEYIIPNIDFIYSEITQAIIKKCNLDISDCFLDGTKIEANANKYKFVWKPTNKHIKLDIKIKEFLLDLNLIDNVSSKELLSSKELAFKISKLSSRLTEQGFDLSNIKTGKGIRTPKEIKDYLKLIDYLDKVLEYEEQKQICGDNRNSYYKTDHDATAMCLKEDYYSGLGSNMHAGYNAQIIVSKGIILSTYISQERSDYYTFIPALSIFKEYYGIYPKNLCADSGYGSLDNYRFTKENNIGNYIKYNMWRKEISGSLPSLYDFSNGNLYCLNNKIGIEIQLENRHVKSKGNKFYKVSSCLRCPIKSYCGRTLKNKIKNERIFEVNPEYYAYKKEARSNLLTVKGIEMRVNRSSQVEGAFGVIKQDMNFDRFRRKSLEKVRAEFMLISLGYNIRKFLKYLDNKGKFDYWKAPKGLVPEKAKTTKILKNKTKKYIGKNEVIKKEYKSKYHKISKRKRLSKNF